MKGTGKCVLFRLQLLLSNNGVTITSFPRIQIRYRFYINHQSRCLSQNIRRSKDSSSSSSSSYSRKIKKLSAMEDEEGNQSHRICDYCDSSVALVYCKADSAKLCLACDKEVHVTNQLFSKHFRSLLCDSCHDSPCSVFCETERSVLCQNCDWQHHSTASSSSLHTRRPFEGFSGCPSVPELLSILGLDDLTPDSGLPWETPEFVSLNDLIVSGGSATHNFKAMDVPPLPKVYLTLLFLSLSPANSLFLFLKCFEILRIVTPPAGNTKMR